MIAIIVVVAFVVLIYFYSQGYINFPSGTSGNNSTTGADPITLSLTAESQTNNLYANEPFQVVSYIRNNRDSPITISLLPYGCSSITQGAISRTIPANVTVSITWPFTAPSSGNCQVQITSCFSYISYANYPMTIKNQNVSNVPLVYPSFSESPLAFSIASFNSVVIAPPSTVYPKGINQTYYISAGNIGSGGVSNQTLNWLKVTTTGKAYIQLSSSTISVGNSYNITKAASPLNLFFNGAFTLPILITIPPVSSSSGYAAETINISAGYTYCIHSNSIPVSVG